MPRQMLLVMVPLAAAVLAPLLYCWRRVLADATAFAATIVLFVMSVRAAWLAGTGRVAALLGGADGLSRLLLTVSSGILLLAVLFSMESVGDDERRPRHHALLLAAGCGVCGAVLATDLVSLLLFAETAAIAASLLAWVSGGDVRPLTASRLLSLNWLGAAMLAAGLAVAIAACGGSSIEQLRKCAESSAHREALAVALALLLAGFAMKTGLMPWHSWSLAALSSGAGAAGAVTAGTVITAGGLCPLLRLLPVLGHMPHVLGWCLFAVGIVSAAAGSVIAALQDEYRRLLAYAATAATMALLPSAMAAARVLSVSDSGAPSIPSDSGRFCWR